MTKLIAFIACAAIVGMPATASAKNGHPGHRHAHHSKKPSKSAHFTRLRHGRNSGFDDDSHHGVHTRPELEIEHGVVVSSPPYSAPPAYTPPAYVPPAYTPAPRVVATVTVMPGQPPVAPSAPGPAIVGSQG